MKDIRLWDQSLVAWHVTAVMVENFTRCLRDIFPHKTQLKTYTVENLQQTHTNKRDNYFLWDLNKPKNSKTKS